MKKVLLTSCIAAISTATSANVFLPNIGIDGWDSDNQYFRGAALNQGYLTTSGVKNHTINPAFALDRMESAEARMDGNGSFGAGVFTEVLGQNVGVYFNRPTNDGNQYDIDTDGDGELDDDLLNGFLPPSNILDAYWAANLDTGKMGVRLNYRALGYKNNQQINNDDVDNSTSASLYEFHSTLGFISNNMPLEATATLGLPFGGYNETVEDDTANTKEVDEVEVDKGLRWGATGKYTLSNTSRGKAIVSGFLGSSAGNYNSTDKTTDTSTGDTTVNVDTTYIYERFTSGVVGSYEEVINSRTRLNASAGLTRTSMKIGTTNNLASPAAPNHDKYVTYSMPVAVGIEFRKSEKTMFIGSVGSNLFNSWKNTNYDNNGGDAEKIDDTMFSWSQPNTNVEFGMSYQMTSRLETNFVINKLLFNGGLDEGLTTTAEFTYDF